MAVFTVDTDALAAGAGQALTSVEQLRLDAHTLSARLAPLETAWTGASSASFQSALAQWKSLQQQVGEVLDALGRQLGNASAQYADAERLTSGMFR